MLREIILSHHRSRGLYCPLSFEDFILLGEVLIEISDVDFILGVIVKLMLDQRSRWDCLCFKPRGGELIWKFSTRAVYFRLQGIALDD